MKRALCYGVLVLCIACAVLAVWFVLAFANEPAARAEGVIPFPALLSSGVCLTNDGSGDLEPCEWQKEREAAAKRAADEARDKTECRAKACRVHHFRDCTSVGDLSPGCVAVYHGPNPRMWFCDCDWKMPTATATQTCVNVQPGGKLRRGRR